MSFLYPEFFWLFLVVVPVGFVFFYSHLRGKRDLATLAGEWRSRRVLSIFIIKSFFSSLALGLSWIFLVLSLAGPTFGNVPVEENSSGLEVALVVDISRSMLVRDFQPHRLGKTVDFLRILMDRLRSSRFSLTVFKGQSLLLVPSTHDPEPLHLMLDNLSPELMTAPGTDLRSGLVRAMESISLDPSRYKAVVLFSDGDHNTGESLNGFQVGENIPFFTVGMATAEGGVVRDTQGNPVLDSQGNEVVSRLNDFWMRSLSQRTKGQYFSGEDLQLIPQLLQSLGGLQSSGFQSGVKLEPVLRYKEFLILSLLFLMVYLFLKVIKWKNIY